MANDNLSSDRGGEVAMEILGESDCWTLLREVSVGRIAFPTADGGVNIFPVNHLVDGGSVVFRTGAGEKLTGATPAQQTLLKLFSKPTAPTNGALLPGASSSRGMQR